MHYKYLQAPLSNFSTHCGPPVKMSELVAKQRTLFSEKFQNSIHTQTGQTVTVVFWEMFCQTCIFVCRENSVCESKGVQ